VVYNLFEYSAERELVRAAECRAEADNGHPVAVFRAALSADGRTFLGDVQLYRRHDLGQLNVLIEIVQQS
jgi:hypothetical protein